MGLRDRVYGALAGIVRHVAHGRQPEFTCGDCDRWQRCGLPPDKNCLARAAQMERIAREGGPVARRRVILSAGAGWIYDRG